MTSLWHWQEFAKRKGFSLDRRQALSDGDAAMTENDKLHHDLSAALARIGELEVQLGQAQQAAIELAREVGIKKVLEAVQAERDRLCEELAEWDKLRSWFMSYPVDQEDEKLNQDIANAPVEQIVKAVQDGHQKLKEELATKAEQMVDPWVKTADKLRSELIDAKNTIRLLEDQYEESIQIIEEEYRRRIGIQQQLSDANATIAGLREALEAVAADLRNAFSDCQLCAKGIEWKEHDDYCPIPRLDDALSRTPPQHRAAIEAGVLRRAANDIDSPMTGDAAKELRGIADRIDREIQNK